MTEINQRTDGKRVITVILANQVSTTEKQKLHCLDCGRIVLEYYTKGDKVVVVGEMREVTRPKDILCSRCKVITRVA